ncbi:MAG: glycosyltransferase, partial [Acidobacteriota bacterium]|nr:glycosyltransferase [Acidobacteriota bacterium]
AMACGVAPVATRVGGVPELITDGKDGYLEAVGDVDSQARRVIGLLRDGDLFAEIASAARDTALTRFCTDEIIPQYESYYRELV